MNGILFHLSLLMCSYQRQSILEKVMGAVSFPFSPQGFVHICIRKTKISDSKSDFNSQESVFISFYNFVLQKNCWWLFFCR